VQLLGQSFSKTAGRNREYHLEQTTSKLAAVGKKMGQNWQL